MSAVVAMWEAAGRPTPDWQGRTKTPRKVPVPREGVCCLTGQQGTVFDYRHVVSDNFNGWDRLPFRTMDTGFSAAAAWAFRYRVGKSQPHLHQG